MFSRFFIERPVFATVLSIVIVLLGTIAMLVLPVDRYPDIAPPTIEVTALYPGATAATIAETVATPIEKEVNGVEGMLYMTSSSSADGTMTLRVTFETGTDLDMANVLVQNRVALAEPRLPEEVRRLGITVKKQSSQIALLVNLYSPDGRYNEFDLNNYASSKIRDELTRVNGVGEVMVFGTEYAMRIWLDIEKMRVRNLTTNDVVAAVREQNIEVAAGQIGEPPTPGEQPYQLTINTQGRLNTVEEFEQIVVRSDPEGGMVQLHEIARVELGAQNYLLSARFNTQATSTMGVFQMPGSNAIEVADGVEATMQQLRAADNWPRGMEYKISFDSTQVIRASLREVVVTLFITLGLVVATVYLFLQNFRATLIPALTIPVSLVGTFIVMAALGYSLNILTLFGLVLVIGIVVDDAIVVVENTTRLIDGGMARREAAIQSMKEVTGPVVATTLVLLAVFVPTIFLGGIVGQLFQQFAMTISIATLFSSFNALTLSPALCGILLRPTPKRPPLPFRLFNAVLGFSTGAYLGVVRWALRLAVLGIVLFGGLYAAGLYGFATLPGGFVPQEDEGYFLISTQLPDAASMERTQTVMNDIDRILLETEGFSEGIADVVSITGFNAIDGSRSPNAGTTYVVLKNWEDRETRALSLRGLLMRLRRELDAVQEAQVVPFPPPSLPGVGATSGLAMQVQYRGDKLDFNQLQRIANEMVTTGTSQEGLARMFTTFRANVPQLFLDIDRRQAKLMGIPLQEVFNTLGAALGSAYINDFTYGGRIYQVKAQAAPEYRMKPGDIRRLEVRHPEGGMTPLGALLEVEETLGPQTVAHFNIYPSARINGSPAPGYSSGQAMGLVREMAAQTLPADMSLEWTELSFQEAAASGTAGMTFLFSIIMVYLVLAAQYESWAIPMAIILTVPAALVGGATGALLLGFDNNVYTQIGVVLLIGLSAKTSILIVEFAKAQREEGQSAFDAALNASRLRFRAVLMTAMSFILGVIPLLVATGAGAHSRRILGTTVFSGMLLGTILGLVAAPMLYFVIQWLRDMGKREPATASSPSAGASSS